VGLFLSLARLSTGVNYFWMHLQADFGVILSLIIAQPFVCCAQGRPMGPGKMPQGVGHPVQRAPASLPDSNNIARPDS
jgi:hypothetical protein